MIAATSARVAVLTLVLALAGCSSAPPRAEDQPPVMSQYKSWSIGVMPSVIYGSTNIWRARVRVWPPEVRPDAHPGIELGFNGAAAERRSVEQAATATARRYIDASVSTH
jgi:hypothetical protein